MTSSAAGSLAGEGRSVTGVREPDSASGTVSDRLERLTAALAESVHLQAQLNERFAVRLLEFGSSVGAIEMICRQINGRIGKLTAARVERAPVSVAGPSPSGYAPKRFDVVYRAPALMVMSERVVLYGLVFGLRPQRCLEIGTHRGGSALIIAAALDDLGEGTLSCVDLAPQIDPEDWRAMAHRATLFSAPSSPGVFHEMAEKAAGRFDFALIDGDHSTAGALRDINGMLGVLEDSATIVLHDAHNDEVAQAVRLAVENRESGLTDCGMISTEKSFDAAQGVYWGGMRMLRFSRREPARRNG
jgi:predicted O-methyltransferase YrrM